MHAWIMIGALSAMLTVVMGAFGAHSLAGFLSDRSLAIYQTAAQYQMYHSLGLLALGLWILHQGPTSWSTAAGWGFVTGILVFSGSLYALALTDIKILGAITPIGGIAFIVGWLCFAMAAFKGNA